MSKDKYESPLSERYASPQMQYIFSPDMKFRTWRRLWIALAETERELGLPIREEQIEELRANAENINYEDAKAREKVVRHDVMSHVYAYGLQCPKAKGIIHLGATSCYVGDNTDIIVMREALYLVRKKILNVLAELLERNVSGVLRRNNNSVNSYGLSVVVFNSNLCLAVGTEITESAVLADFCQLE